SVRQTLAGALHALGDEVEALPEMSTSQKRDQITAGPAADQKDAVGWLDEARVERFLPGEQRNVVTRVLRDSELAPLLDDGLPEVGAIEQPGCHVVQHGDARFESVAETAECREYSAPNHRRHTRSRARRGPRADRSRPVERRR